MKYSFCYIMMNRTYYTNEYNGVEYDINNFENSIDSIIESIDSEDDYEVMDIIDAENNKYHFEYNPKGIVTGVNNKGLMYEYLNDLGLIDELKATNIPSDIIINKDNTFRKRILNFEQFRVYLVRYYPKNRDQIHKFFRLQYRSYQRLY